MDKVIIYSLRIDQMFFLSKLTNGQLILISIAYSLNNPNQVNIISKTEEQGEYYITNLILQSLRFLLNTSY